MKHIILLAAILTIITACTKESSENIENFSYYLHPEIEVYFERFEAEGKLRGQDIDLQALQISGHLEDIEGEKVLGQCFSNPNEPNSISIDAPFWEKASDTEKEFVIFHELGHCYLGRSHLDSKKANGRCVSMMHSGTNGCRFIYNSSTRSDYLDELFSN